ncbi:efflux transporter outer membrane subunit [Desulfopila sp. IMCC35008]|uniref:efflux transporter outer membrane subunit n=1 Tax=Desulfopila sp. IMCC35008 TaxID=2653858 RepID=UPI0013CF9AC5|nr:efflux transporter outer membrane subunit [Desulfopila sp. IMCC35008]
MIKWQSLCGIIVLFLLSGCTVGPDYLRPEVPLPENWRLVPQQAQRFSNLSWWDQYGDPQLSQLITEALDSNLDLAVAAARIEELMGLYGSSRSAQRPKVDGIADWTRSAADGLTADLWQLKLSSSWEIDLWGRLRRNSEAAWADMMASEAGRSSLVLSLVASVATAYIDLLNLDRQLEIAHRTTKSRQDALDVFTLRLDAGLVTPMEVAQIRSEYHDAMAVIPQLEQDIAIREHGLCVLLGRNPGPIRRGRVLADLSMPQVPVALPAQILNQRPDIRQAEESLIAANARIGVARAAYFPTISLTGVLGSVSGELSSLLNGSGEVWSLGVPLSLPIFSGGQLKAGVETAEARQKQALLKYRQTILKALQEVEDGLVRQQQIAKLLISFGEKVAALQEYAEMSRLRYEEGYVGYLEILDAQRSLFASELLYTERRAIELQSAVALYKATGGGWNQEVSQSSETAETAVDETGHLKKD